MRIFTSILSLALLTSCVSDPAWETATSRTIPGKNMPGKCNDYAKALHKEMQTRGVKSKLLVFGTDPTFVTTDEGFFNVLVKSTTHAAVVYYYPNGETYAMDNTLMRPLCVGDGDAGSIARQIVGPRYNVSTAYFAPFPK